MGDRESFLIISSEEWTVKREGEKSELSTTVKRCTAHVKVSQQQTIEFLLDPLRGLRAQGTCRQTQMRFDLINALLDFPALMVDLNEGLNGIELGIQQGGDQPHRRAERAGAGILELVLNHAGSQHLPTSTSAVL